MNYPIKVHIIEDGSKTATCGAWILYRLFPDGRLRLIGYDAPLAMREAALEALGIHQRGKVKVW